MIQGVVFDWAGTVIDYGCLAPAAVFVDVFRQKQIDLSLEQARGPMGMAKIDHVRELTRIQEVREQWTRLYGAAPDEADVQELYRELEPGLARIVTDYSELIPGVAQLVQWLKESEIRVGSTTGYVQSMMKNLIPAARAQGFDPDVIVCSDEVPAGRPAPWGIFLNAQRMNVYPLSQMVKIGDTIADIQEGLNADMWVIATTKSGNELGLTRQEADELPDAELTRRLDTAAEKFLRAGAHYVVEGVWDVRPVLEEINQRIQSGEKPPKVL